MIARYQRYQEIAQGLFIFSSSRDWGSGIGGKRELTWYSFA